MGHALQPKVGALHGAKACAAADQRHVLAEQLRFCRHAAILWPANADYWRSRAREKIAKLREISR